MGLYQLQKQDFFCMIPALHLCKSAHRPADRIQPRLQHERLRQLAHQDDRAVNWRARADRLRALPLPVVLAALEATPDPRDPAKWRTARGVLSVTGAKFINWNQGVGGGGAIDLVMHVQQVGFGQALQWLEASLWLRAADPTRLPPGHPGR